MDIIEIITSFEIKTVGLFVLFAISSASLFFVVHSFLTDAHHRHKIAFICMSLILWTLAGISGWRMAMQLIAVPAVASTAPTANGVISAQKPVITYLFSAPVDFATLAVNTYPPIDLEITPRGYLGNKTTVGRMLTLSSKTTLPPGERYMIYLSNVEGPLTRGYGGEHLLEAHTSYLDIVKIDPADAITSMAPNQTFTVKLTEPISTEKEWSIQSVPDHPFTIRKGNAQTLIITPETPLRQATQYDVKIIHTPIIHRLDNDEQIQQVLSPTVKTILRFATVRPAFITSLQPQGSGIDPTTPIRITFDEAMDRQSVTDNLTITPAIPFVPVWDQQGKILTLTHGVLPKDTAYLLTLNKGIKTAGGGQTESASSHQFHTAGAVTLSQSEPASAATDVSNTQRITLTFDQDVPPTITDFISSSPAIAASMSAQGKTVTVFPSAPLAYETRYTITVKSGAPTVYGLPSASDQSFSFTTTPPALPVVYYRQQSPFTCNIAAARMLLSYRGVMVTEKDIINAVGIGGKRGSGNPYKGYIDDYGTYWDAISRGVTTFRPTRLISGGKLSDIIAEVQKGNPVMTWGQNGWSDPHEISWTASDGTFIRAINGMHSAVVRGYTGPANNPTKILLNDPWRGQYAIDTKEFMRRWGYFGVAMVVD